MHQAFSSVNETVETETLEAFDTFDWRLYHKGWQLIRQAGQWTLSTLATDQPMARVDVNPAKPCRFHQDFPPSDLAERLKPVLEMRALVPLMTVRQERLRVDLCNDDEKTVVRLRIDTLTLVHSPHVVCRLWLEPIRGYKAEARTALAIVTDLVLAEATKPALVALAEASGMSPGAYSSKVNVSLSPEMPAADALRRIMENLVAVMHSNLAGVREDIDSEFLHDLRVSVRRARSLLGQVRGVLPEATSGQLQQQLKTIGTITGPVRDLDVYLLKEAAYVDRVPGFLQDGIKRLFQNLARQRRTARNRLRKAMDTPAFAAALAALDAFVAAEPVAETAPIGPIASAAIWKRYRRVVKRGRRITDASAPERLHELRITCKKLRYLLEFFASLYPAGTIKELVRQLKQLQENLGDFNDLSVQQEFLRQHLDTIRPASPQAVMLAAATGGLITRLAMDQEGVRARFLEVFAAFDAPANRERFKSLFAV
ncbi:CHAD domain-containing protein [Desulfosarcina cetonica]